MDETTPSAYSRRRSARYAARRRERQVRAAWWVSVLLISLAFAGGFLWVRGIVRVASAAPTQSADPAQRVEALRLLDRAVEARHTELTNEAARLAFEAKKTDPTVPGADLFVAEMALRQGDAATAVAAAQEALAQARYTDDARLILALNAWMLRGEMGTEAAGASAMQLLREAAEDSLSNSAVRFFAGDLERATGRLAEAHRSLLGGLYRQQIWQSAALLAAKLALSVEEAGPDVSVITPVTAQADFFGSTIASLHRTQSDAADAGSALNSVHAVFTQKHCELLARDPALSVCARKVAGKPVSVPFGHMEPPSVSAEPEPLMPWEQEAKTLSQKEFRFPAGE